MITFDAIAFHSALDERFGFIGFDALPAKPSNRKSRSLTYPMMVRLEPSVKQDLEQIAAARNALRRKGWTQVQAARVLGVTPIHLSYVLNGRRESRRILSAIDLLPENPTPA